MKKSFFNTQDAGKFFLWSVVAPQLLALIVEVVFVFIANGLGTTTEELFSIPIILICFTMLAQVAFLFVILTQRKNHNFKIAFRFDKHIPIQNIFIAVVIGVIAVFSFTPIVDLFNYFLAGIGYNVSSIGFEINSVWRLILGILLMALVPAVLEELIFRGAIFQGLKRYGKWIAMFATSALFMLVHCNLQQLIFPFVISIILCNCVLKTDNILTAMIVHFIANATSIVLSYFQFSMAFNLSLGLTILLAVVIACVGFAIMWGLTNLLKPRKVDTTAEKVFEKIDKTIAVDTKTSNYYLYVGIFLGIVFFVISVVVGFMPAS